MATCLLHYGSNVDALMDVRTYHGYWLNCVSLKHFYLYQDHRTPLMVACQESKSTLVTILIQNKADINAKDCVGFDSHFNILSSFYVSAFFYRMDTAVFTTEKLYSLQKLLHSFSKRERQRWTYLPMSVFHYSHTGFSSSIVITFSYSYKFFINCIHTGRLSNSPYKGLSVGGFCI